ncbi:MAG: hypothetical protein GY811_23450 [Myxococcales bacterium]|nr:hypothetical protein [Myxococcales bacterium]
MRIVDGRADVRGILVALAEQVSLDHTLPRFQFVDAVELSPRNVPHS